MKIDGLGLNDGPGHSGKPNDPDETDPDNDPHVGCGFQLEFFNFDTDETADIEFTAHPPTGNNGVLLLQEDVVISDDGTGGANNDPDAVLDYNVLDDFDTSQFTGIHPVHGWHVKLSLTLYDSDGKKIPGGQKHKVFWVESCLSTLTVDKVVEGGAAAPADWSFDFSRSDDDGDDPDFTLTDESDSVGPDTVGSDPITITELDAEGADATSISCTGVEDEVVDGLSVTVEVPADTDVVCTFTNTYLPTQTTQPRSLVPETGSLQIVKAVTGDAPSEWSFDFIGAFGAFTLDQTNVSDSFDGLTAGAYRVSEVDDELLDSIDCGDEADVQFVDSGVLVTLDAGENVSCTFTNFYPEEEVLDEAVENTTTAPPTTTTIVVKDDVAVQTLPRTGSENRNLAVFGVALVLFGAVLLGGSRRLEVQGR